jgi:hypothetical protein
MGERMEMGDPKEAEEVRVVDGGSLKCTVCQHTKFWSRKAQLNTSVATFFGFDWLNRTATCYVCERCKYVHWFLRN